MPDVDVVVIGAGLGGLTAGAMLAKQGRSVLVLEQGERVGGCCSTFERDGYCFDVGASLIEIIQPLEKAFHYLGTSLEKEVDLIECDPENSFIFEDGSKITLPRSVEQMGEIIRRIDPQDGRRWPDFVSYCSELLEVSLDTIFNEPADGVTDMARMIMKDPRLAKFLPAFLSSYEQILGKYFKNETVLSMMSYQSLYFGLPPALVPGAYAMLPYTEHTGIYYPRGGMIQVPLALQRCGERLGMQVRLKTAVDKVLLRGRQAVGVRLEDGTEISSRLVVSNVNARTLYLKMIGEANLPPMVAAGVKSYQNSLGCAMIYLGLNYAPPLEAHHSTVAISPKKMNRYWWEHQEKGVLPADSFGLICWSTRSDPSLAPKGKHVLNIIPEGFYHLKNSNWEAEKPQFIERVLGNFDKIIPGLEDHIEVMDCATPLDYERRLRLPEGAIYCLKQDLPHENVFRPAARSKAIQGLYLTGASTNPGGGVPSVIASGVIAANLIGRSN